MKILLLIPLLLGLMTPAIAHNGPNTPGWEPPNASNTEGGAYNGSNTEGGAYNGAGGDSVGDKDKPDKPDFEGDLDL